MIKAGGFLHSWVGPNLFIPGKHGISVMESMVYWVLVLDRVTNNSPVLIGYPVTVFLTLSYLDHPFRLMQQVFSGRVEVLRGQKKLVTGHHVTERHLEHARIVKHPDNGWFRSIVLPQRHHHVYNTLYVDPPLTRLWPVICRITCLTSASSCCNGFSPSAMPSFIILSIRLQSMFISLSPEGCSGTFPVLAGSPYRKCRHRVSS